MWSFVYIEASKVNTNAWTRQIASSNAVYPLLVMRGVRESEVRRPKTLVEAIIPKITCPALMLADSRNERVRGRI